MVVIPSALLRFQLNYEGIRTLDREEFDSDAVSLLETFLPHLQIPAVGHQCGLGVEQDIESDRDTCAH